MRTRLVRRRAASARTCLRLDWRRWSRSSGYSRCLAKNGHNTRIIQRVAPFFGQYLEWLPALSPVKTAAQDDVILCVIVQADSPFAESQKCALLRDRQHRNTVPILLGRLEHRCPCDSRSASSAETRGEKTAVVTSSSKATVVMCNLVMFMDQRVSSYQTLVPSVVESVCKLNRLLPRKQRAENQSEDDVHHERDGCDPLKGNRVSAVFEVTKYRS